MFIIRTARASNATQLPYKSRVITDNFANLPPRMFHDGGEANCLKFS